MHREEKRSLLCGVQDLDYYPVIVNVQGSDRVGQVEFHRESPSRFHLVRCILVFDRGRVETYVYENFPGSSPSSLPETFGRVGRWKRIRHIYGLSESSA